jgi:hypothetical protein
MKFLDPNNKGIHPNGCPTTKEFTPTNKWIPNNKGILPNTQMDTQNTRGNAQQR